MANEKFTQLPTVANSTLADIIAAVQAGVSVQQTLGQVASLLLANTILNNAGNPNGSVAGVVYQFCWDTTNHLLYVCTTSGNAATAVWTLSGSVAFPIPMSQGGTGANLTASNGAIPYSTASAIALLAPGTSGQLFQSGGAGAPNWTTATYPSTITSGNILFGSSSNVVGQYSATANSVLGFSGVSAMISIPLSDGQFAIGSSSTQPAAGSITPGAGIKVANGSNTITVSNNLSTYATTTTAAATTTLVATSAYQQFFTGTTTQTVLLPVTSTLVLGQAFYITNNSTGVVTVESSGGNTIQAMAAGTTLLVTCILTSGTTAASWFADYNSSALSLPLSLANGGTNNALIASAGGILWSDSTKLNILSGTSTAGQLLLSGNAATPAWSTSTYPSTNAINTLLYASSANTMAALATANYGVLVTSSSGVPSISSGGQIPGTRTNDNGSAGNIGEYIYSQQLTPQSLSTGSPSNVVSISLTAGDWDITGYCSFNANSATTVTYALASASTTSATLDPNFNSEFSAGTGTVTGANPAFPIPSIRLSLSGTTTVYLVAQSSFGVSTMAATGFIAGRRAR